MKKKVLKTVILSGPGYEDDEVSYPFYRLNEEGILVDVATSNNAEVKGKHGRPLKPTIRAEDLKEKDYDAVIIPGGHEAPDRVRQVPEMVLFVIKMYNAGKLVSSICHGPWVLIEAGIVQGKKATCYKGMKTDLINAGAIYRNEPVVKDGNIITSQHPTALGSWMKATINWLVQR